jgi:hypothetical protein
MLPEEKPLLRRDHASEETVDAEAQRGFAAPV